MSGFTQLLFLVAVVIGVIALLAVRKPVFFRMAVRNISRIAPGSLYQVPAH